MGKLKELLYPWAQRLRRAPLLFWFILFRAVHKTRKNTVLFYSSERETLTGNLQFLYDALRALHPECKVTVVLKGDISGERRLARLFASSELLFVEEFEPRVYVLPFGKSQRLVQVWHAIGAFKKVGFARENTVKTSLSHRNYTDVIVSSEEVRPCYAESFGVAPERVHALGVARTDAFFDEAALLEKREALRQEYPVLREKKLLLFAPTFRGDNRENGFYPQEYFPVKALAQALKEEFVLGIKLHPLIKNKLEVPEECRDFVIDLTGHREVNDLLPSAAVLVTDYSSVIFENALLGTPVVFYVPDYEEYARERGFYFPFETYLYGEAAKTPEELAAAVQRGQRDDKALEAFRRRFLENCDGHASERIIRALFP